MNKPIGADGVASETEFHAVPLIDFGPMLEGNASSKAQVAAALREACTKVGFFYVANHGIPLDLVARMFAQCTRFFSLPLADKMALHFNKSSHHVGYIAMGDQDPHEAFDFVAEDVHTGTEFLEGDFRKVGNLWPCNLSGFREVLTQYSVAVRLFARRLFGAFALALGLPQNYFASLSNKPMAVIRMLYYPSQPGPFDEARLGTRAHTDNECFTILCQDDVQALQVRNRRGDWVDTPRIPGTIVVNIGDLMARWTNGLFSSTPHRVANFSGRARYSIPCFVAANADAVIEALPSCIGANQAPKFPPVVAGEYVATLAYHIDNGPPHPLKQQTQ